MLTNDQIRECLFKYGDTLFPITLSQYLNETQRQLWGLYVNLKDKRNEHMFGNASANDILLFNSKGVSDSLAGYRVNARDVFPNLSVDVDVFLLNVSCLELPVPEIEALIIHELCHWYINSGLLASNPLKISTSDSLVGKKLYKKTDVINEHITEHSLLFCNVLSAVAGNATKVPSNFLSRKQLIELAMNYDLVGNLRS